MKTFTKSIIIFLFLLFVSAGINAQNLMQDDPRPKTEEAAKETSEMWARELALSMKQFDLMKDKIAEFLMKKNSIVQSRMTAEEKRRRLKALQNIQYKDMRDILTKRQFERYVELSKEGVDPEGYEIVVPEE